MEHEIPHKFADRLPPVVRRVYNLLMETYQQWRARRTLRLGAGIAYYAVFAIVPLLSLAAALAARLVSAEEAREFLVDALDGVLAESAEGVANTIVDEVTAASGGLGAVSFIVVLISASFLFLAVQDALNVIWEAPVRVGLRVSIRRRLLAFAVSLGVAFYFIAGFVIQAIVGLAERIVPGEVPVFESLAAVITTTGSWALGMLTIAILFRVLPYAVVKWRDAFIGGAITAGLVALGTSLIGAYVSRYAASSLVGAAGSVVAFLVWVYYQSQILLGGAVLTKVMGERRLT